MGIDIDVFKIIWDVEILSLVVYIEWEIIGIVKYFLLCNFVKI